jgi:sugar O-acyltransferase (sialic acid O-acetyltransferase NeuD family)
MSRPVIIIGFGGHGRVVADGLLASGVDLLAATDSEPSRALDPGMHLHIITDEDLIRGYSATDVYLAVGVGSIWPVLEDSLRRDLVRRFESLGYRFVGLRHPGAIISPHADISETAQLHAGSVVQVGAQIGSHVIINTRASIDHDCRIGDFCHVGPGATLSGGVEIGEGAHIGTGAAIVQGVHVGPGAFIAAGATVTTNIGPAEYVRGTPARPFQPKPRNA